MSGAKVGRQWLIVVPLVAAGLLFVGIANWAALNGYWFAPVAFWTGLLMLYVTTAARLVQAGVTRQERIVLVTVLGLALYFVKVAANPLAFTFPDELNQVYNVEEALQTGHLFGSNPLVSVTSFFPGLTSVTTALVSLSGLTVFEAGLLIMGATRVMFTLALFLLCEQLSGSARVASLASLLYTTHSNYLYYNAEFSYEALAIPFVAMTVFSAARIAQTIGSNDREQRVGQMVLALTSIVAAVITHHVTSYALVVFLWLAFGCAVMVRRNQVGIAGMLALFATGVAGGWLLLVAGPTVDYLSAIAQIAQRSLFDTIAGVSPARQLFGAPAQPAANPAPPSNPALASQLAIATALRPPPAEWEKWAAILAVLLVVIMLPLGIRRIRRQYGREPLVLALAVTAVAYVPLMGLRLVPGAWETSVRSLSLLFAGIGFVLAVGMLDRRGRLAVPIHAGGSVLGSVPRARAAAYWGVLSYVTLVFVGGVTGGWPSYLRMAQPYLIGERPYVIEPESVTAARWTRLVLGPGNAIATNGSPALLLAYGHQIPYAGRKYGIADMLASKWMGPSEQYILQVTGVRYVVLDREVAAAEPMQAGFFVRRLEGLNAEPLEPQEKFDKQSEVNRLFDSGDIIIYDVARFTDDESSVS